MVPISARAPAISVMRLAITSSTTETGRPFSSATRSRRAGSNAISPRMARSVIADTCVLQADQIGQFVDAFLTDHGGIHVGDQQLLAAMRERLDREVERGARECRTQVIGELAVGPTGPSGIKPISTATPGSSQCISVVCGSAARARAIRSSVRRVSGAAMRVAT